MGLFLLIRDWTRKSLLVVSSELPTEPLGIEIPRFLNNQLRMSPQEPSLLDRVRTFAKNHIPLNVFAQVPSLDFIVGRWSTSQLFIQIENTFGLMPLFLIFTFSSITCLIKESCFSLKEANSISHCLKSGLSNV